MINDLKKLERFYCSGCNLGPTLSSGLLKFRSPKLKVVTLYENNISKLKPKAITGLRFDTEVYLSKNNITELEQETFLPILEDLWHGNGSLFLSGNPIQCGCKLAWLVFAPELLRVVKGTCENGTVLKTLHQNSLNHCRSCPYYCVSVKQDHFCARGTLAPWNPSNCTSEKVCCKLDFREKLQSDEECGRKKQDPQGLIAKGNPSGMGKWPWQAAIYDAVNEDITCGGALIQKQWVLTAAHCVTGESSTNTRNQTEFRVYLGKHYRHNFTDDKQVQLREVSKIIVHEDYHYQNYDSDIALLKLTEEANLTARVQLVCLPTPQDNPENRMLGWVAGWGYNGSDVHPDVLMEAELPVVSINDCRLDITRSSGNPTLTQTLTSNMFCGGHDIKSPEEMFQTVCPGDSGSPMVFRSAASWGSPWQVMGIVSHFLRSTPCSLRGPGYYGIFTNVSRIFRIRFLEMVGFSLLSHSMASCAKIVAAPAGI
ncbi:unnamed protein product [Darwinula stevensoni]|uniref:Peptidase S1 domain-containing protein n=1 Tax=Darwinula stevensoni TaxID=69355 RepID=A0A7R9FR65_9CRUS|nr:unnamed protein product [Darwinula stevensoni]CAG0900738.1 unnamed protein product [Darwinula stevensoni]